MSLSPFFIPLGFAMAAVAVLASAQDPGVFSAAQAQQGATVYGQQCAACHGDALQGGAGPALKGSAFTTLAATQHLTGRSLLDTITRTMPMTAPGSLTADQYAQVTAYILQQSGYPAGSRALSKTSAGLDAIDLSKPTGAAAAAPAAAATVPAGSRLASTGVYSDAQMQHGKALYADNCMTCHGGEMDGIEDAPPLAGKPFMSHWGGATVAALSGFITAKMPPGNAGALGAAGETDVIAYMLAKNGFPAGATALSSDTRQQATIVIDKK